MEPKKHPIRFYSILIVLTLLIFGYTLYLCLRPQPVSSKAVSYTHLDVYKRQPMPWGRSERSRPEESAKKCAAKAKSIRLSIF